MIENSDADQIERLNSRVEELLRERDVLVKALEKIIEMNRQHAKDQYGDADKAESWACITVARAALESIKDRA